MWGAPQHPLEFWPRAEVHLEVGLLRAATLGNKDPIPGGEGTPALDSWSVGTGSSSDQVAG